MKVKILGHIFNYVSSFELVPKGAVPVENYDGRYYDLTLIFESDMPIKGHAFHEMIYENKLDDNSNMFSWRYKGLDGSHFSDGYSTVYTDDEIEEDVPEDGGVTMAYWRLVLKDAPHIEVIN